MSKPGPFRRAPAILKRRAQPPSVAVVAGGGNGTRTSLLAKKPLVIEVKLQDAPQYFLDGDPGAADGGGATPTVIFDNHAAAAFTTAATAATAEPVVTKTISTSRTTGSSTLTRAPTVSTAGCVAGYDLCNRRLLQTEPCEPSGGCGEQSVGLSAATDGDDPSYDDAELDVWDIEISADDQLPPKDSVSTQVDFPSRAVTALTRRLIDHCGRVSPVLASRAAREDLVDKLGTIVDDAATSTKARFLLEQILSYKSRVAHHSSFMARHSKVLMEISPKAYRHLKSADGSGLLTLPSKATLRNRYPDVACATAPPTVNSAQSDEPQHYQQHPSQHQVLTAMSTGELAEEQVVLEVAQGPVDAGDGVETDQVMESEAIGTVGIHEVVGQTPTYYYVVPGGDESVLLSNVIMDHHVEQVGEPT